MPDGQSALHGKLKGRMSKKPLRKTVKREPASSDAKAQMIVLHLCISGMTPRSREALKNLKRICDDYLEGQYQLEVIDLYQQPELAAAHQIIATPTLLKSVPAPLRRLIGDLSDTEHTLRRLGVVMKKD
jgi:circadian clock protein KaiB